MNSPDQIPFRVFCRVPAPGIKLNELYIPQYYMQGAWASWATAAKPMVSFATEREAQLWLIDFVKNKVEKTKQRVALLNTELGVLEKSLVQLNRETISIVARNPEQ